MENNLRSTFKQKYDRKQWQSVLIKIMGDDKVNYSLIPKSIALTDTQLTKIEKVLNIGAILTSDRKELPIFEIHLKPTVIIERNRVTVNEIIKQYLIKDARDGAIAVFYYPDFQKTEWRFSFISPGSENSFFEELEIESTNSKRYSYVFGVAEEEHRTAARQFIQLSDSKKTLNDFFEAFNVEKMSKEFFDEYKNQYELFIKYILQSNFKTSAFNNNEKTVRDFVKKLLGRIIFLYFIQKKGWLGASSINYKDGDKNFLQNLFNQAASEVFYPNFLSKLFFDTLNKKRDNDDFEMPDGSIVKIPFLNGGLFDKVNTKYDRLTFSPSLFQDLFNFLNRYNFTIYEDSPDDHTVAVDPEMLGHIFENLLEDNKDKGAFYTPKEIVQYMTQESLIEYLHTHLPTLDKKYLILLVKYKSLDNIQELKDKISDIDYLLDKVKICDPAIGSGAFPMGLLQEIFALKDLLMHEKGFDISDKARVKEHIIQNSIYGVDIEQGAVDIARLRFWLSLVVYEDIPKPLPNLDFKIVVGDSLLTKFEDQILHIDWEVKSAKTGKMIAADIRKELNQLSQKQKEYFESANKATLNQEIRELKLGIIEKQIRFNQLQYNEHSNIQGDIFEGKLKRSTKQDTEVQSFGLLLNKIASLRANPDKELQFFDWKLNFPEVLNPLIVADNQGFDIVIGNPPYLKERDNAHIFRDVNNSEFGQLWHEGKMDYWFYFLHKSLDLSNGKSIIAFITSRYWINSKGAKKLIQRLRNSVSFTNVVDIGKLKVFDNVAGHHMIAIYSKVKNDHFSYKKLERDIQDISLFNDNENVKTYSLLNDIVFKESNEIIFAKDVFSLIGESVPLGLLFDTSIGVQESVDKISRKQLANSNREGFFAGQGVFVVTEQELATLNFSALEKKLLKRYIEPVNIIRYGFNVQEKKYLIYSDKKAKLLIASDAKYLNIRNHLDYFSEFITSSNGPYGIHRPREKAFFDESKIIFKNMFASPEFTFDDEGYYFGFSFSSIIQNDKRKSLKYLLAILNSSFAKKWFYVNGKHRGAGVDIGVEKLRTFPIIDRIEVITFEVVVDYLLFVNKLGEFDQLNEFVPNSHIIQILEEVIDAMVFELYFSEDFEKAEIKIIEYVQRDFKSIEGLEDSAKKEVIHQIYQKLREKDNEIRNNLKEMKIELRDLVMPIITA
jgi:hypothetical protein